MGKLHCRYAERHGRFSRDGRQGLESVTRRRLGPDLPSKGRPSGAAMGFPRLSDR